LRSEGEWRRSGREGAEKRALRAHLQLNQDDTNSPAKDGDWRRPQPRRQFDVVAVPCPSWASTADQHGGPMRSYALVSGVFLAIVAVAHLVRAVVRLPVVIADVTVPVWCSYAAFLGTGALALWAFRERRQT
jgi:hypothetical protein